VLAGIEIASLDVRDGSAIEALMVGLERLGILEHRTLTRMHNLRP
jgi:hypothetical protein